MKRLAFFDTNIFIYTDDISTPAKQARAIELITEYHDRVFWLFRFRSYRNTLQLRPGNWEFDPTTAQQKVQLLTRATRLVWRAQTFCIAKTSQHGATLGGVRINNPFLAA